MCNAAWVNVVTNQGYHLDVDSGFTGINSKIGQVEREELYRCEMIDAECEEYLRREKMTCKNKDWYYD